MVFGSGRIPNDLTSEFSFRVTVLTAGHGATTGDANVPRWGSEKRLSFSRTGSDVGVDCVQSSWILATHSGSPREPSVETRMTGALSLSNSCGGEEVTDLHLDEELFVVNHVRSVQCNQQGGDARTWRVEQNVLVVCARLAGSSTTRIAPSI